MYIFPDVIIAEVQQTALALMANNAILTTAESCTGGLIAGACTEVSGSSCWFYGGVVSYDNYVKEKVLGVSSQTLSGYGAVSKETVEEMATGGLRLLGGTICVAVSGIAGPTGGTADKPVGTIWLATACYQKEEHVVRSVQHYLQGTRSAIRLQAVQAALQLVRQSLATGVSAE